MKLYYSKGACSLIVRIIINELGLDCEYESVDLKTKKTQTGKDFLTINPKGSIPLIQLNNGDTLTENAVILQYLADNSKATHLLPQVGNFNRYQVLTWLNYISTELHKSFSPLFNPSITQELKNQIFIPIIKAKLTHIDKQLENHQYLLGGDFTLPDAYLFVMLRWTSYFNIELNKWSNLTRYFNTLNSRASIQKSLKQEG